MEVAAPISPIKPPGRNGDYGGKERHAKAVIAIPEEQMQKKRQDQRKQGKDSKPPRIGHHTDQRTGRDQPISCATSRPRPGRLERRPAAMNMDSRPAPTTERDRKA